MQEEQLCLRCKEPFFSQANQSLCNRCAELLFNKVKEYINAYSYNSIQDIADNTGVEKKLINKWLREGRLELVSADALAEKEKLLNLSKQYQEAQKTTEMEQKTIASSNRASMHYLKYNK
ncbi:transposase-like protein [Desulfitispora alkaliphila]|uniref:hypothetical protein n=1 Tax=Desulfitispora alkaliphila TaxID=622674 RepID=UPI003D21F6AC